VISIVVQESNTISAIHFNTARYLHDGAHARVYVRGAGGKGQDQEQAFHSVSPSGRGNGLIDAEGVAVSSQIMLWSYGKVLLTGASAASQASSDGYAMADVMLSKSPPSTEIHITVQNSITHPPRP
jgi:hypothetical protein